MEKKLVWKGLDDDTLEICYVETGDGKILVNSDVKGTVNDMAVRIAYALWLNTNWTIRSVKIDKVSDGGTQSIRLFRDGEGRWFDDTKARPEFDECIDIDIMLTPLTNSLPIKRLGFNEGESRELRMVYFDMLTFEVRVDRQRYTNLGEGRFKFEALDTGYQNEISFTQEGYVQDYPGLFSLQG